MSNLIFSLKSFSNIRKEKFYKLKNIFEFIIIVHTSTALKYPKYDIFYYITGGLKSNHLDHQNALLLRKR